LQSLFGEAVVDVVDGTHAIFLVASAVGVAASS
jgi:hypothetical protein